MTFIKKFSSLILLVFLLISCDSSDPWAFIPPDFSSVPSRYDISGVEPTEIDEGVTAYIIDRNEESPYFVTQRDIVTVDITLRTDTGEIIFSTFANDTNRQIGLRISDVGNVMPYQGRQTYQQDMVHSPGLQTGLLDMKEGEIRTLIVDPEQGFQETAMTLPNEEFRNSTLIYDIHLIRIDPS